MGVDLLYRSTGWTRLASVVAGLNIFDAWATAWSLSVGAIKEANPIMAWLWDQHLLVFFIPKLLVPTLCLYYLASKSYAHRLARIGILVCFVTYLTVALQHLIVPLVATY